MNRAPVESVGHSRLRMIAVAGAVLVGAVLAMPTVAQARIVEIEPASAEIEQGQNTETTIQLSHAIGLTCLSAKNAPQGVVVVGIPGCLLGENVMTIITNGNAQPGDYTIVFEERAVLGGGVVDSVNFELTVLSDEPPPTTTTTKTTTTTTTTTTRPTVATTAPTTTTSTSTSTTTTVSTVAPPATTTTPPEPDSVPPSETTVPGGSASAAGGTTTTSTTAGDEDPDDGSSGVAPSDTDPPPDGAGLPKPQMISMEDTGLGRALLAPFLPDALTDVIISPLHVLGAVIKAAMDTALGMALTLAMIIGYSGYLVKRWMKDQVEVAG